MEKSALNKRQLISSEGGFIMVEAIVGVVLASTLLTVFISLNVQATKLNCANVNNFKADMYLKELIEITKDLEQSDWDMISNFSDTGDGYHPEISADNEWELFADVELVDNRYTRSIIIENVKRNREEFPNVIDPDGPYNDPNTKKIIACIKWNDGSPHEMKLETYVYNYNDL